MKVLVDTSVWSLALRKKTLTDEEKKIVCEFTELIKEFRVVMIGPVRQELLSGISSESKYNDLRTKLSYFEDTVIETKDYEKASEVFNLCRKKGVQGSHIDFLICAVAINRDLSIFTTDKDFQEYTKAVDLRLHTFR